MGKESFRIKELGSANAGLIVETIVKKYHKTNNRSYSKLHQFSFFLISS
jgi:hypothetical protein